MKKTILFFFSFLFLSCTNDSISEPETPVTEEPETPTETRLPIEINYRFNFLDINRDYTSENLYTYDDLNRVTEIEINSKVNNTNYEKYNYRIVYSGLTSFAKGFEIKNHNYQTGENSSKFIKFQYPENYDHSTIFNYVYYNYVNSYQELLDNNFTVNQAQKIRINSDFKPVDIGNNLKPNTEYSLVQYFNNHLWEIDYITSENFNWKFIYIHTIDTQNKTPQVTAFTDVKFDYIFWFFFLEEQLFHFEVTEDIKGFNYINAKPEFTNSHIGFIFKNDESTNVYINNKYPTYKKYTSKQVYGSEENKPINFFEYNVIYN